MTEKTIKVKPVFDMTNNPKSNLKEFYEEFLQKMEEAFQRAEQEMISLFAEELQVSRKCAKYFIEKNFELHIETESPNSMIGTPRFNLVAIPLSAEEILNREFESNWECEKEFIKNNNNGEKII